MTKLIAFEGVCLWACIQEPKATHQARKFGGEDSEYSILVECSQDKFQKLKAAGIHKDTKLYSAQEAVGNNKDGTPKSVPDNVVGKTFIRLKKSCIYTTRDGRRFDFGVLKVIDKQQLPFDKKISNGSTVNCIVGVEKSPIGGIVLRLKCVQVLDYIEFQDSNNEDYGDLLKGTPASDLSDLDSSDSIDSVLL